DGLLAGAELLGARALAFLDLVEAQRPSVLLFTASVEALLRLLRLLAVAAELLPGLPQVLPLAFELVAGARHFRLERLPEPVEVLLPRGAGALLVGGDPLAFRRQDLAGLLFGGVEQAPRL